MSPPAPGSDDRLKVPLPVTGEVIIHVFPHDARFVRDIRRAALAVRSTAASEADMRELLQRALRAWYPRIEVRVREDLASIVAEDRVWYVMRDGRAGRGRERSDRLYAAMSDARATTAEADVAVERAHATLELANRPRAQHVAHPMSPRPDAAKLEADRA